MQSFKETLLEKYKQQTLTYITNYIGKDFNVIEEESDQYASGGSSLAHSHRSMGSKVMVEEDMG